jgi:hypothetical protein
MARGGRRPGSGRKHGSATRRTREIADAVALQGVTPLDYLVQVMRSPSSSPAEALDAAKAAAPYMHPRLTSVALGQDENLGPISIAWEGENAD